MTFLIWLDDVRPIDKRYDYYVRHGNYADPKSVNAAIYWIKEAEKWGYKNFILDLYIEGVITKEQAQTVLGFDIEDGFYPESSYAKIYKEKKSSASKADKQSKVSKAEGE